MSEKSLYTDRIIIELKRRLWKAAFKFATEIKAKPIITNNGEQRTTVSGEELMAVLDLMKTQTVHHWVADKKTWNDILASDY